MSADSHNGDAAAAVLARHHEELRSFLQQRTGSTETTGDLLQELYLRLRRALAEQSLEQPRAYAFRVAANLAADHGRRQQRRAELLRDAAPNYPREVDPSTPELHVDQHEQLERLAAAIDALPPRCQAVFRLRKIEQMSQARIAERLGISQSMVEKHLRRALAQCRTVLED